MYSEYVILWHIISKCCVIPLISDISNLGVGQQLYVRILPWLLCVYFIT